jgi:hypothetical protein
MKTNYKKLLSFLLITLGLITLIGCKKTNIDLANLNINSLSFSRISEED